MNKKRRVNIIRALKVELAFYKRQPVKYTVNQSTHAKLCLQTYISRDELAEFSMYDENMEHYLMMKRCKENLAKAFEGSLENTIPIEQDRDNERGNVRFYTYIYV